MIMIPFIGLSIIFNEKNRNISKHWMLDQIVRNKN